MAKYGVFMCKRSPEETEKCVLQGELREIYIIWQHAYSTILKSQSNIGLEDGELIKTSTRKVKLNRVSFCISQKAIKYINMNPKVMVNPRLICHQISAGKGL